jgi:hypothetical protein
MIPLSAECLKNVFARNDLETVNRKKQDGRDAFHTTSPQLDQPEKQKDGQTLRQCEFRFVIKRYSTMITGPTGIHSNSDVSVSVVIYKSNDTRV